MTMFDVKEVPENYKGKNAVYKYPLALGDIVISKEDMFDTTILKEEINKINEHCKGVHSGIIYEILIKALKDEKNVWR
jgi:hypothetical protein